MPVCKVWKPSAVLLSMAPIISRKDGRKRRLYFNTVPIQMIHDRWTSEYSALWAKQLTTTKYAVESAANPETTPDD